LQVEAIPFRIICRCIVSFSSRRTAAVRVEFKRAPRQNEIKKIHHDPAFLSYRHAM
jgi:hypothetical protein